MGASGFGKVTWHLNCFFYKSYLEKIRKSEIDA
jgi:hypothetical protein